MGLWLAVCVFVVILLLPICIAVVAFLVHASAQKKGKEMREEFWRTLPKAQRSEE